MGWLDDSWRATAANAEALEDRLLKIAVASLPATPDPTE
jgi:hypothetical protein